jgi:hypothetical protein
MCEGFAKSTSATPNRISVWISAKPSSVQRLRYLHAK